jgi:hypothetical protein
MRLPLVVSSEEKKDLEWGREDTFIVANPYCIW